MDPNPMGHSFRDEGHLLDVAGQLAQKTAAQVADAIGGDCPTRLARPAGKTGVGRLVEEFLGLPPDNIQSADIMLDDGGEVEVKSIPLKQIKRGWTVKEATSITMIDYMELPHQTWKSTPLRHKLDRILWFPYDHHLDRPSCRFRRPFLWSPDPEDRPMLQRDFETVKSEVAAGRAHELSESVSHALAARRKGATGRATRPQPHHGSLARSRAWAFKMAYTRPIIDGHVFKRPSTKLIEAIPGLSSLSEVESIVERRLAVYEGQRLDDIQEIAGGKIQGGKSGPANFVRQLLGVQGKGKIQEFEKLGIVVRTVWARDFDLRPWAATSFPAVKLREFAEESWAESALADDIDRILFIPLLSGDRRANNARRLGRPFFWSPSPSQRQGIAAEWGRFQRLVREGKAAYVEQSTHGGHDTRMTSKRVVTARKSPLPSARDTTFIHMRPHGADRDDVDEDPLGNAVTKQSFWLNKDFVQRILRSELA